MNLSDLQMKEIARIETILKAFGCKYGIQLPDGSTRGTDLKQAAQRQRVCDWAKYDIKRIINALKIGEVAVFVLRDAEPYTLAGLQSVVSGHACAAFGNGNSTTAKSVEKNAVEILRIA